MENCRAFQGEKQPAPKQNSYETYTPESMQLVNASVQGSEHVLTCKVQHEAQPPTRASLILSAAAHSTDNPLGSPAFLLGFKVLLVIGFMVLHVQVAEPVTGPAMRAPPEQTVSFTCRSHGFSPRNISLKWFKNGNEIAASKTSMDPEGDSVSYSVSSTAKVVLAPGDVRSQVICEVDHVTLQGGPPLRGTANLSETIRVPPTLEVTQQPMAGTQVNITCQAKQFYPRDLQLSWVENGNVSRIEAASTLTENKDGTFNRTSWLLVNSSAHRGEVLSCRVEHDGQPAWTSNDHSRSVHVDYLQIPVQL
nr:tyrosine-protein phosphatase non-receptor type substrate 1-like [Vicugna pacos]